MGGLGAEAVQVEGQAAAPGLRGRRRVADELYAGTLTIGGLIERGDIHAYVRSRPEEFGAPSGTFDPDDIAEAAWRLYADRDRAEAVISALT